MDTTHISHYYVYPYAVASQFINAAGFMARGCELEEGEGEDDLAAAGRDAPPLSLGELLP